MPSRSVVKSSVSGNYYQLQSGYSRSEFIYLDESDYRFFLYLLEKYLFNNNSVELLAYCLESDHYNLLLCQIDNGSVAKLMHNIITTYNRYFFNKYGIEDLLPESDYGVSIVPSDDLLDTSRCIHIKPDAWIDYPYSSLRAYFYDDVPCWLNKAHIAKLYGSAVGYLEFLS